MTNTELAEIAEGAGISTESLGKLRAEHHNDNRFRSDLLTLTAVARMAMWQRGELQLSTALVEGAWADSLQ